MRTISTALNAYQKKGNLRPLVRVDLLHFGPGPVVFVDTAQYDKTRIADVKTDARPWSVTAQITLDNADKTLTNSDFKGYQAALSWGLTTSAGDEYAPWLPMTVIDQKFVSTRGSLTCVLYCVGIPNMMAEDRASAAYLPDDTSTVPVSTLITQLCSGALPCFSHCQTYGVVFDSTDTLMTTYVPKSSFRIYKGGSRLAALRRLMDYTGCAIRWAVDGSIHVFVPTTAGTPDYEYSLASGYHTFFAKAYRELLVIPNKVTVSSPTGETPFYSGYALDAVSYDLLPKEDFREMYVASAAEASAMATAIITQLQLAAEGGSGSVPINLGADVYDYARVTDAREGDTKTGNIGYISCHYSVEQDKWETTFGFGGWANPQKLLNEITTGQANGGQLEQSLSRLVAKSAYIENLTAEQINLNLDLTQDDVTDGTTYKRVLGTQITAGKILISDATEYAAGYDPATKLPIGTTLDGIPNGSTYSRVKSTQVSAGEIVLSDVGMIIDKTGVRTAYSSTRTELTAYGLRGFSGAALQVEIRSSDGKMYAGAGAVMLDQNGLTLSAPGGSPFGRISVDSRGLRIDPWAATITKNIEPDYAASRNLGSGAYPWLSTYAYNVNAMSFLYANTIYPYTTGGTMTIGSGFPIVLNGRIASNVRPNALTSYFCGDVNYYWLACFSEYFYYRHAPAAFDSYNDSALIKAMKVSKTDPSVIDMGSIHPAVKYIPTKADSDVVAAHNAALSVDKAAGKRQEEAELPAPTEFIDGAKLQGLVLGTLKELIGRIEALEAKA